MGLFGTKKAQKGTVESVLEMIEKYFKRRHLDMDGHALDDGEGYGWWLMEGSAKIYVFIQDSPRGVVLRITSPILHFPHHNREMFFLRCLDINRELSCCSLAVYEEIVLVTAQRPIEGLDQEELNTIIWNVSNAADVFDDMLSREFDCRVYNDV